MKMIRMDEVRSGDVVARRDSNPVLVTRVRREKRESGDVDDKGVPRGVGIYCGKKKPFLCCIAAADELIALLYRPWSKRRTERDMLNAVVVALARAHSATNRDELNNRLATLRDVLEVYELGKPLMKRAIIPVPLIKRKPVLVVKKK